MKLLRKFHDFAPWDAKGIAAHLEEMEANGWLFRGTDVLDRWEYVKCEPRAVRWAVAYAPSRTNRRLMPTDAERDLEAMCADDGWEKIAALSKFHIYRNPDPECTPLESDEISRLDTMNRSLHPALLGQSLLWGAVSILVLGILCSALSEELPRYLAMPALPGAILFLLWLIFSSLIPWVMYRRFLKTARSAAETGLPCPAVTGWKRFSRCNYSIMALLLLWILGAGSPLLILGYTAVLTAAAVLRRLLPRRISDEVLVENLWQGTLAAVFILLVALNLWNNLQSDSPKREAIPLMAQDLMDTAGMDLEQFDLNGSDALWASYHDYWQAEKSMAVSLRYEVFDLRLPLFWDSCEAHFLESFHTIAARDGMTVTEADAALWNAEQVMKSAKPGQEQWLILCENRIIQLHTSWNLTEEQIAAAAEKLAP